MKLKALGGKAMKINKFLANLLEENMNSLIRNEKTLFSIHTPKIPTEMKWIRIP